MNQEMSSTAYLEYPTSLPDYNASVMDGDAYKARILSLASVVFNKSSDVLVLDDDGKSMTKKSLQMDEDLESLLGDESCPRNRIVSIASSFTLDPLNITRDWMLRILNGLQVTPNFVDVLLKFGDQPQIAQESSGCNSLNEASDGSYNICYDLRYIESNGRRAPKDPYSMRHTGVFHRYTPSIQSSIAIILHPMARSRAEHRLRSMSRAEAKPSGTSEDHPLDIHFLILSSYLNNWQPYIETLAEQFMGLREKVLAIDITRAYSHLHPDTLATLRNLEDKISFRTLSGLKGSINTINMLLDVNTRMFKGQSIDTRAYENAKNILTAHVEKVQSHVSSVEIMEKRIVATIGSLSSLLELRNQSVDLKNQNIALKNQASADRLNQIMLNYTRETVYDNKAVKMITIFTLVYLPASFVASLLGMNLFDYQDNTGRFKASPDLWIFFVIAVPLTLLTLGLGWYIDRGGKNERQDGETQFDKTEQA